MAVLHNQSLLVRGQTINDEMNGLSRTATAQWLADRTGRRTAAAFAPSNLENYLNMISPSIAKIDVWCVHVDSCIQAKLMATYASLLSYEERARNQRFVFERDRQVDLVARALVRTVLGRRTDVSPNTLCFDVTSKGKPTLVSRFDVKENISFNLTHSNNLVMLVVASDRSVGIDVEYINKSCPFEVIDHCFTNKEVADLYDLPAEKRTERFWALWTLKEALVKSSGNGLMVPLNGFCFNFDKFNGGISLQVLEQIQNQDLHRPWRFYQWRPSTGYLAAICIEAHEEKGILITEHDMVPLVRERRISVHPISPSCNGSA